MSSFSCLIRCNLWEQREPQINEKWIEFIAFTGHIYCLWQFMTQCDWQILVSLWLGRINFTSSRFGLAASQNKFVCKQSLNRPYYVTSMLVNLVFVYLREVRFIMRVLLNAFRGNVPNPDCSGHPGDQTRDPLNQSPRWQPLA